MKIVVDQLIPDVESYFSPHGEVIALPAAEITADTIKTADALIIRSVTKVDAQLLAGSMVKFIGSATSGYDHIDTDYLDRNHVAWYAATGCNAAAVAEYVICCIASLQDQGLLQRDKLRIGVIGVGHVGRMLDMYLSALGVETVLYDPPRAQSDKAFHSVDFSELYTCDMLCLHPSLSHDGIYPSYHLINNDVIKRCRKGMVILNASRGGVVDEQAVMLNGRHLIWCLDVWHNEPEVNVDLLRIVNIATPHIAGHSVEAKQRGIEMVAKAFYLKFNMKCKLEEECSSSKMPVNLKAIYNGNVLSTYDPMVETDLLKSGKVSFESLRKLHGPRFSLFS